MKVIFFDYSPFFGGAEQSLISLIPLLERDIDSILLCAESSDWISAARDAGINCRTIRVGPRLSRISQQRAMSGAVDVRLWKELSLAHRDFISVCREERPNVVCANTFKAAVFTGLYRNREPWQLAWHIRDIVAGPPGLTLQVLGAVKRPALIAVSRAVAGQPALDWPGARPILVYNGIDCGVWRHKSEEETPGQIRSKIGLGTGEKMLAAFGQLVSWKGQEHVLKALALLRKKGVLCRLALVGDAVFADRSYPARLKATAERLGIGSSVKFCGWVKNPAPYMAAADIVVHTPARPEPFGRVVVEAMCLGKPVVAFKSGAIPEIIEDGRSGLLCSEAELPLVLEKLIYDPRLASALGEAGRRRVEMKFSLSATAAGVSQMLMDLGSTNWDGRG